MIGFDLQRDTEKGVRRLEEQVEDNEVPMEEIPEINLIKTHDVLQSVLVGCINYNTHFLLYIQLINTSSLSFILSNLPYNFSLTSLYLCVLLYFCFTLGSSIEVFPWS